MEFLFVLKNLQPRYKTIFLSLHLFRDKNRDKNFPLMST